MKMWKSLVARCSTLAILIAVSAPAHAQSCTDQADCTKKATDKVSQALTPKLAPVFGDYPKFFIHDSLANVDYPAPKDTETFYDASTGRTGFNFPANSSLETTTLAQVDPNTGFTVMLVQKTRDNTAPTGGSTLSLLSSSGNDGYLSFMLGAQPAASGQKWAFGKSMLQTGKPTTAFWQQSWDMDLLGPTGTFWGVEWVYYTFTPDGKVRVDRFAPYTYFLAFTAYQWDQALLDSGFPHVPFPTGTPTGRPNPLTFGGVGPWVLGAASAPGQGSPTINPIKALPGYETATIFSSPLSPREVVAYQNTLKGSYFLDVDMQPCNSGKFLDSTIKTPCGTASPGNPPSDVATAARTGFTANVDPNGVILQGEDGNGGSFSTIQAAINALPATGGTIRIPPGVYSETINITQPNVKLIGTGTDATKVVITGNHSAGATNQATGQPYGTSGSYTVAINGDDAYVSNLTIQNTADYERPGYQNNAQAVALLSNGDRAVYRAVRVLGGQDTLYLSGLKRAYFSNCYVEGYVDYIFGNGKAVFDGCTLKTKLHGSLIGENTITAQKRETESEDSGFVFNNTRFLFDSPYMTNAWLGRPWGSRSTVYFLNSTMGPQITDDGWIEFVPPMNGQPGTNNLPTSTYREYNTKYGDMNGQGSSPFDISQRESASPKSNVPLTASEVAALAPGIYLAGSDGWQPTLVSDGSKLNEQNVPVEVPGIGAPKAPVITADVGGNGNVQVTWAGQPAQPAEQGYSVTARQHGRDYGPFNFPAYAYTAYVEVARNDEPVTVQVSAFNAQGSSAPSDAVHVTPTSHDPSVPTDIVINPASKTAALSFTVDNEGVQPVFGGAVPHAGAYTALYASELDAYQGKAIAGTSHGFTAKSWNFTNLRPNTTYWMSLRVYNGFNSPTVIKSFKTNP
ncbi:MULTISPECIES: pectinesterase family protein [Rhizobium]|uniref:Pectinesterase family protein n=1 Tax=Rhizobium rhododendri TaxID=2506430 RepID=A0ABY8ITR3_9HYPH|nr:MULTISPECIES: pectinesterase family protein [Rhizobium]TQY08182.1 hypothetical protein EQW74_24285 [Rhizobium sp. rho-1.1]WFS26270.1 pectinesterase family protein [Rhizobium rhododendri]